jgi:branched-chain amino acid aminotransferase
MIIKYIITYVVKIKKREAFIKIEIELNESVVNTFKYEQNPAFGTAQVPIILTANIGRDCTALENVMISSDTYFTMSYFSSVLHYGQAIFEGLKAYKLSQGNIGVFRLKDHAKRFKKSAQIMDMPALDESDFVDCVEEFIKCCKDIVPQEEGHSLYLRPLMFSNDSLIKVCSGKKFKFVIMATVVGPYFTSGNIGSKILLNKQFVRAFPYGTGEAKTSANYALSLPALQYAQKNGFEQVLYIDAKTKKNIDELGGMNFFMLKGKTLITPILNGTILAGITRDTIITIAASLGLSFEERILTLDEVLNDHEKHAVFACGTAATIAPIVEIGVQDHFDEDIKRYRFGTDDMIKKLRLELINCQLGNSSLSQKWMTYID